MCRYPGTPKIPSKTTGLLTHFHATINANLYIADMKWEGFSGGGRKLYFKFS